MGSVGYMNVISKILVVSLSRFVRGRFCFLRYLLSRALVFPLRCSLSRTVQGREKVVARKEDCGRFGTVCIYIAMTLIC